MAAFQKKSTGGIKTPKREIDLIKDRLQRLKERSYMARSQHQGIRFGNRGTDRRTLYRKAEKYKLLV